MIRKRPTIAHGATKRIQTGCGKLYVTLNRDEDDKPIEVFVRLGKAGGCASSQTEALGRLISIMLKHSIGIEEVVKQLSGIGCHQPAFVGEGRKTLSCADAVSQALVKIMGMVSSKEEKLVVQETSKPVVVEGTVPKIDFDKLYKEVSVITGAWPCPDCGSSLTMEEGCAKCHSCGWTKC